MAQNIVFQNKKDLIFMNNSCPKVSIITVCYNAATTIEKTLKSVTEQDYPNIEYIIIDGKSKDNTLEVVAKYQDKITKIISEEDKNTFDAMNKGLATATGDYIWYIHADDQIFAPNTLSLAMQNHGGEDFVYGKTLMVNEQGEERSLEARKPHPSAQSLSWKTFINGMVIGHQAMIVKRAVSPIYDLKYPLVGDLDWVIRVLQNSKTVRDTNIQLCRFVEGGISTQNRKASLRQRFEILRKHFGWLPTVWQHLLIVFQAVKRGSLR